MDTESAPRPFDFARDTFAFANELVWAYQPDPATGKMNFRPRDPRPDYTHRCFVLTRVARQFFYHARFEAALPPVDEQACRRAVRAVVSRSVLNPARAEGRVTIPGYASLREFSAAQAPLLKSECGGAWRSYVLRSHWRMVFPISRAHQERTLSSVTASLQAGVPPVLHLVKFPALTINHSVILFDVTRRGTDWEFSAYDPNDPAKPARLTFNSESRTFLFPANNYWGGGALDVIEICRNWLM